MMTRLLDRISLGFNHAGTLLIVAAMLLVVSDVIGRGMGSPVRGVPEMVGASIVAIVFLQIANALRAGRMIRSDSMLHWLGRRQPRTAHLIEALFAVTGASFFAAILYAAIPLVREAVNAGTFIGVSGYFTMPIWPVKSVVVIGCLLAILQYLRLAWEKFAAANANEAWHGDVER
jgi:TRAP-type mannitol/chloroaromatic compound transport system permease small subunit